MQGFVIIGAALAWSLGSAISTRRTHIPVRRSAAIGFALLAAGIVATAPVLRVDWPLGATFASWCLGGLGMGFLFNPTSAAAMGWAGPGRGGRVGSQINLADSLGFALMGGVGGATVAVADRTSWRLDHALAVNFGLALVVAVLGAVASRGVHRAD